MLSLTKVRDAIGHLNLSLVIGAEGFSFEVYLNTETSHSFFSMQMEDSDREGIILLKVSGVTMPDHWSECEIYVDTISEAVATAGMEDLSKFITTLEVPDERKYELAYWIGVNICRPFKATVDTTHTEGEINLIRRIMSNASSKSKSLPKYIRNLIL